MIQLPDLIRKRKILKGFQVHHNKPSLSKVQKMAEIANHPNFKPKLSLQLT